MVTFIFFVLAAAFAGGLGGTILSVITAELDSMSVDDLSGGKPFPSGRVGLLFVCGIPAALLGQRVQQEHIVNPWVAFLTTGFGVAILSGTIMFFIGRSYRR